MYEIFIILLSMAFAAPVSPESYVGILEKREAGANAAVDYHHSYLFRFENGKWLGALKGHDGDNAIRYRAVSIPEKPTIHVYFDGRSLGEIDVPVKKVPAEVQKISAKFPLLVTATNPKATDPEHWQPVHIKKRPFMEADIHALWKKSDLCKPMQGEKLPQLKFKKVYAPKDGSRFLVIATKETPCKRGEWDDYTSSVWFFRNKAGEWKVVEGNDFVDIGDFNGDGKTEGLFVGEHNPPTTSFVLKDMSTFEDLVSVEGHLGYGE